MGEIRRNAGHVIDIVPTVLELADVKKPSYPGAPAAPGKSLVPTFGTDHSVAHDCLWWFHQGSRALRVGDLKIVADADAPWELYDVSTDRAESKDLAKSRPEKVKELANVWESKLDEFRADAVSAP
jgi:arylsulfatase